MAIKASDTELLEEATAKAGALLELDQAQLQEILGNRRAESNIRDRVPALLFLQMFRSLDMLVGGDDEKAARWLHGDNQHLNGVPAELIGTADGLARVTDYLDGLRTKL